MTFKEYLAYEPLDLTIDFYLTSDDISEKDIENYYNILRKELLYGKHSFQNSKWV